ncbi:A-kinase anchor protein 6 [Ranitomeya imitator]|uniref:A-kinase anchor protein 6 n=1 Tax=Ranitomeya imitator TaxID=111125 RepID=UPI0037E83ED3
MSLKTTGSQEADTMDPNVGDSCEIEPPLGHDCVQRSERPPPVHTGADWKIILHLPEIDTWIRCTAERVRGLTQSVQEDPQSKHVDVHLMQLKEICEDISDHVEQIHALLDTEFSLKLLSYSVNVIVDIHTVQLLWHQLRVSVLVLRERILQGLQDSNGNYTRQTDILQAFTKEEQEDRLDALTEVDGSGQLTIRCPPDYLSLDCGITAFELSDYSPREEDTPPPPAKPLEDWTYNAMQQEFPDLVKGPGLLTVISNEDVTLNSEMEQDLAPKELDQPGQQSLKLFTPSESTTPKRPLQESNDHGGDSPTRPSLPKRGLFLNDLTNWAPADNQSSNEPNSPLPVCPTSPPKHFGLIPTPTYSLVPSFLPSQVLEDDVTKQNMASREHYSEEHQDLDGRESSSNCNHSLCSTPNGSQNQDNRLLDSSPQELGPDSWYGSDEFLALPPHLHQADLLALRLGSLSQLVSPTPEEPQPALRDVEDWEISSGSELGPSSPRCISPSTSSEMALYLNGSGRSTPQSGAPANSIRQNRAALIQRLMWDIQRQDNDRHVWEKIQGFVSKLDKFIHWLQDAMQATENWTPPQAETEALQLYLHTHLNFKQSVDGHSSLKDAVLEEGHRLMEVLVSHRPGFQEMLQMITAQWKELQKQIRRQHGWIMGALDTIKADILQKDEIPEVVSESQVDEPLSSLQAQRDAVTKMSLQLSSAEYTEKSHHSEPPPLKSSLRCDSVQDLEGECQEFWDWLLDMEATVQNSLGLLVSEEQHLQMCKRCSVELSLREDRVHSLLCQLGTLRSECAVLPDSIADKEELIREKWDMLKRSLSDALSSCVPHPVLSPGSGNLVQQLDQRVKELKSWLRDTELALYNSSLRVGKEENHREKEILQRELHQFQTLCSELRLRRRGVSSILRLCHHLLNLQDQIPQHDAPNLQLLSVNLERRWEAIVMQSTQWQRRLLRDLGEEQEMDLLVDPDWADLSSAPGEEALEWDETDIITEAIDGDRDREQIKAETFLSGGRQCTEPGVSDQVQQQSPLQTPAVYQVYSVHDIEIFRTNIDPSPKESSKRSSTLAPLPLSLLQGFPFLSLPDLADGSSETPHFHRKKHQKDSCGLSESESGIASGEGVTAANSEGCLSLDGEIPQGYLVQNVDVGQVGDKEIGHTQYYRTKPQSQLTIIDSSQLQADKHKFVMLEKTQRLIPSFFLQTIPGQIGANRTLLTASSEDHSPEDTVEDLIEILSPENTPPNSSSLESLSGAGEVLESAVLRRSVSLESWPASYKSNEDLFSQQGSADITPGSEPGEELSKRTLDLLKRLEDIECPLEQKMKRSLSDDITLRSCSRKASLTGLQSPQDKESSCNEDVGSELTELSSSEELSLRSEDMLMLKDRLGLLNSNASFRKHLSRSLGGEESEANLSMIVNVSCTSACTDEEDDSDLLSSSTLTLTEEEEEEELEEPNSSLGSEDDGGDGTDLPLGSDFIRRELQAWIRPSFFLPGERRKINRLVQDMSGTHKSEKGLPFSMQRQKESNENVKCTNKALEKVGDEEMLLNSNQLVDDMENGNLNNREITTKDTLTKRIFPEKKIKSGPYPSISITKTEKLHPPSMPALAFHKPRELGPSSKGKSNLRVTSDSVADVDMLDNCLLHLEKDSPSAVVPGSADEGSCSCHSATHERSSSPDCSVQDFVKEILDMTSNALHGTSPEDGQKQGTGAQIRKKVLEHSRKQLERGDFYSYLSLSSHDSDCGELSGSARAATPPMSAAGSTEDQIERMFEACPDESIKEQTSDESFDLKGSSELTSPQPILNALPVKDTAVGSSQNRPTISGQQSINRVSVRKFQDNSTAAAKGANNNVPYKKLPSTKEVRFESKAKSSVKSAVSSLPILHKRVRDQRTMSTGGASLGTGHQKRPLNGSKTNKDV